MTTTYTIDPAVDEAVRNSFTYHAPFGDQPERYVALRTQARDLALALIMFCPQSRERSLAITNLEQAIYWANASIARNERQPEAVAESPQSG
jgi:hypothetical protein